MSKNFDGSLQELLRNHAEQPPLDCWDKISSHLDAMQSINASSAANTSSFSQFVGSVVGKVAVTAVVATSIAVAAYFVFSDKNEMTQTPQTQEVPIAEQDILPEKWVEQQAEMNENKAEKIVSLDKIAQENNPTFIDTTTKRTVENENGFSPISNPAANPPYLNSAEKESSPQPPEIVQKPQSQPIDNRKVSVVEPKESEEMVENNAEPEDSKPPIVIYNIFTPNGDKINDYFFIEGLEQVENTELYVYTRDGKEVYHKRNYDNTWNGNGLPDGTYYYVFSFVYKENKLFIRRQGSVSIKR